MDVNQYIEILQAAQNIHKKDQKGHYHHNYFFEIDQDFENLGIKYYISDSKAHLEITLKNNIDFSKLLKLLGSTLDFTVLEIQVMREDVTLSHDEIIQIFNLKNVDTLNLVDFRRFTKQIQLDNIDITHLSSLSVIQAYRTNKNVPSLMITNRCKHQLKYFEGKLDTWTTFENLFLSPNLKEAIVEIENTKTISPITSTKIEYLRITSDKAPYEILENLDVDNFDAITIIRKEAHDEY